MLNPMDWTDDSLAMEIHWLTSNELWINEILAIAFGVGNHYDMYHYKERYILNWMKREKYKFITYTFRWIYLNLVC